MGRVKIVSRPAPNQLPRFKLPFHVRSAGVNESVCTWNESFAAEKKPFVQIFWTRKGRGEVTLRGQKIVLREGDFFYHLPGEEHRHRTIGKVWHYHWFAFDGPAAADFMKAYGYEQCARYAGECPVSLFSELELLLQERTPYAQRHAISVATEILALAGGPPNAVPGADPVRRFIGIAQETLSGGRLGAGEIAAELGIHRTTLTRLFKSRMGMSPGDYLRDLRVRHALSLLRDTDLPVKAVAAGSGLPYASYFCRMVRKITGMTPAGYRRSGTAECSRHFHANEG